MIVLQRNIWTVVGTDQGAKFITSQRYTLHTHDFGHKKGLYPIHKALTFMGYEHKYHHFRCWNIPVLLWTA